jgi:hypothetical protein
VQQNTTAEVKQAGKGMFYGVTLRLLDPPPQGATGVRVDEAGDCGRGGRVSLRSLGKPLTPSAWQEG